MKQEKRRSLINSLNLAIDQQERELIVIEKEVNEAETLLVDSLNSLATQLDNLNKKIDQSSENDKAIKDAIALLLDRPSV